MVSPLSEASVPELEMVMVTGVLVWPTPVVGKLMTPGSTERPGGTPPVPLRATLAGVGTEGDVMVSPPVTGPCAIGANATAAVQVAPAARDEVHPFVASVNCALAEMEMESRLDPPVLVMATGCGALVWPT